MTTSSAALSFLVLGDSLAYGTGAARPADTPAALLTDALAKAGHIVRTEVVAVPGATSLDLAAQLGRSPAQLDLALVVVGANDLTHQVPADRAAAALGAAVTELRVRGADVLVLPTPDLSSVAWVPPAFRALVAGVSAQLRDRQSRAVESAGGMVAPVVPELSRAFAAEPALFSADRFHPSSAGYARVAALLAPLLVELAFRRGSDAA